MATSTICGKPLRAFTTSYKLETTYNTRVNSPGHSKNVKDWAIRREHLTVLEIKRMMDPQRLGVDG